MMEGAVRGRGIPLELRPDQRCLCSTQDFRAWAEENNTTISNFVWATLGQFQLLDAEFGSYQMMWREDMAAFRASPDFRRVIRDSGILDYWQQRGFPNRCRDLGDGDFQCD